MYRPENRLNQRNQELKLNENNRLYLTCIGLMYLLEAFKIKFFTSSKPKSRFETACLTFQIIESIRLRRCGGLREMLFDMNANVFF